MCSMILYPYGTSEHRRSTISHCLPYVPSLSMDRPRIASRFALGLAWATTCRLSVPARSIPAAPNRMHWMMLDDDPRGRGE